MNRILKYIPLLLVLITLASCKTVKFSGKPGTEIYNEYYEKVGEVDYSGYAEVKMPRASNQEPHLFLSKNPETGVLIPFAVNLNPKYSFDKIAYGGLMAYFGTAFAVGTPFFGLGSGAIPLFAGCATVSFFGIKWLCQRPYIAEQTIPQDIVFTPLVETADYKTFVPKAQRMNAQPKNGSQRANTTRRSGNSRYKADDDYTKNVIGTYIGNGKLMFEGAVTEKYNDIKVVIEKVSDEANMVTVNVLLDDGNPYFGSKSKYSITKNDDEYVLIHESVNSTISINQYGELVYLNNDVEDDNGINILKINADKE